MNLVPIEHELRAKIERRDADLAALRAENERLRAALEWAIPALEKYEADKRRAFTELRWAGKWSSDPAAPLKAALAPDVEAAQ
jgi:predicted  nucleic acid-binding Zn-ribbon protein